MSTDQELKRAQGRAKLAFMTDQRLIFYANILFSLHWKFQDSACGQSLSTAATDGRNLYINPDWFLGLTEDARIGLLWHEVAHVWMMHPVRIGLKKPGKYNKAADYAINNRGSDEGFEFPTQPPPLINHDWDGLTTEQIYDLLPDEDEDENSQGDGGLYGDILVNPDIEPEELEAEIANTILNAATAAQASGYSVEDLPPEVQLVLEGLSKPKLPWWQILRKYANGFKRNDYSYRRVNKRFLPQFILPTLYNEALTSLAVSVDSSYSVSDDDLNKMFSEVEGIRKMLRPEKTYLTTFTTGIKSKEVLPLKKKIGQVHLEGRGGTDIYPVFEQYNEDPPNLLIIFTDGEFRPYNKKPPYPVIWIIYDNPDWTCDFGKVIHYDMPE